MISILTESVDSMKLAGRRHLPSKHSLGRSHCGQINVALVMGATSWGLKYLC